MTPLHYPDDEAFYTDTNPPVVRCHRAYLPEWARRPGITIGELRRRSPERDFGVWWRDEHGITYRVSWVLVTGEVVAVRLGAALGNAGQVEVLGVVPYDGDPFTHRRESAQSAMDQILGGWADVCGAPGSLDWARSALHHTLLAAA